MKALFIRCYGKLTADMMIGGLIDMGVPPVYLKSKLKDAGLPDNFIEKPNPKAQISAHYFYIPPYGDKPLLLKQADLFRIWKDICSKGAPEWEETGWKVFSALTAGVSHAIDEIPADVVDLRRAGVSEENLISLYLFLACLDYLDVETLFTCPFTIPKENGERKVIGCYFDRCRFHSGERGACRGCGSFRGSHAGRPFGCLHAHGRQVPYGPHCLWQLQR